MLTASALFEKEQFAPDHQPWFGEQAVFDFDHARIGDQLAGDGEFVFGQGGDELFAGLDRIAACEQDCKAVPRARKGDARPGLLGMRQHLAMVGVQLGQCGACLLYTSPSPRDS